MVLISSFELITLHVLNYLDDFSYGFLNDALDNIFGLFCLDNIVALFFGPLLRIWTLFKSVFTQQALNQSTFDLVMSLNQIFFYFRRQKCLTNFGRILFFSTFRPQWIVSLVSTAARVFQSQTLIPEFGQFSLTKPIRAQRFHSSFSCPVLQCFDYFFKLTGNC